MKKEIKTIKDASTEWVREMNAIQQGMIAKMMELDIDDWYEVTKPSSGDRVYVFSENKSGSVVKYDGYYKVELDDGSVVKCTEDDIEVERYDLLPMWGTMFSFGSSIDDLWLEEGDGIRAMSECGFRIYKSEEFGYFFGIDGCGYDFFEAHWIPLYKSRGLNWHDKEGD